MLGSDALECNLLQKSVLFSNMHLENTGDLSFLQCRNVALRCFIKLGGTEKGGLEIICTSLFSKR